MANTGRQQAIDLTQLLLEDGRKIPFVQVLRLLRLILANREGLYSDDDEIFDFIRIRPELGLVFPGTDIERVEELERKGGDVFRVTATFMGLYGSSSPLPTFYTEDLIEEQREDRTITREFIDIFNHPFYSHFFKIWEKYSIVHRLAENPHDQAYEVLFCLLGLGGTDVRHSLAHNRDFLSYIGIASQAPRSASGLCTIVSDLLQLDQVEVEQCVEYTAEIAEEQRLSLGLHNNILGEDAHLGSQVQDMMGKFRLILGPMCLERLQSILPDTPAHALIGESIRFYLDQPLIWDIELRVHRQEIRTTCPGNPDRAKLGWNTWLFSGEHSPESGRVPLTGSTH